MKIVAAAWLALMLTVLVACGDPRIADFHGVRLGMTAREVRDRFEVAGTFTVETAAANDDVVMEFSPAQPQPVSAAKFEFHMGALVAVRADVKDNDPAAKGASTVVTRSAVLHREQKSADVHVDWLARDCPTHKAEAERLANMNRK